MAAIVTDSSGERWLVERDDPGWAGISSAVQQGLPLSYQVVPLAALLGLPLLEIDTWPLDVEIRCRLWETREVMRKLL